MIQSHKQSVDNNAKCDEQLNEWIEHDPRNPFLEFQPAPAAVPHTKDVNSFERCLHHFLFHRRAVLIVLFFCGEIVDRH